MASLAVDSCNGWHGQIVLCPCLSHQKSAPSPWRRSKSESCLSLEEMTCWYQSAPNHYRASEPPERCYVRIEMTYHFRRSSTLCVLEREIQLDASVHSIVKGLGILIAALERQYETVDRHLDKRSCLDRIEILIAHAGEVPAKIC